MDTASSFNSEELILHNPFSKKSANVQFQLGGGQVINPIKEYASHN